MGRAPQSAHRWRPNSGSIHDAIRVMHYQHEDLLRTMAMVENLASDLVPPAEAGISYHALLEALGERGDDLRLDIFRESDLLFQ